MLFFFSFPIEHASMQRREREREERKGSVRVAHSLEQFSLQMP